jgi:hypothetical protein
MAAIQQQKIRIRLKAFDRRILDASCEKIVDTANRTAATAIDLLLAAIAPRRQRFSRTL